MNRRDESKRKRSFENVVNAVNSARSHPDKIFTAGWRSFLFF